MAYGYPGGGGNAGNTFIATLDLSGHLLVNYGRNLKQSVNRYSRITPVQKTRGSYLEFNPLDLAQMPNPDTQFEWAPGTPRPSGYDRTRGFRERTFTCARKAFSTTLDKRSVDVANWDVQKTHSEALAQDAMTHRIYRVVAKLTDSTQFPATHVVAAATLNGSGFTDGGTTSDPRIKKTLDAAARVVQQDTMGRVKWGNLSVLINVNTALKWSQTREIREYVMQQPDALKEITLEGGTNYNAAYGLPARLYGFNLVVEDTYYDPYSKFNASQVGTPVYPDNVATIFLAEGDLEKGEGSYSFNTCHVFAYEDMTVETKEDTWNRLVEMSVVMDYDVQIVSPVSGFKITNLFS